MPRIDDYKKALELAKEKLKSMNPKRIADQSGSKFEVDESQNACLRLNFLNKEVGILWPEIKFLPLQDGSEVPIQQQVLILHYLLGCPGSKLEGEWIAYQEIPDGRFYLDAFVRRAKEPMLKAFGHRPELLVKLCEQVYGATPFDQGDCSVVVQAFPKVPVALVLWRGDEEFPPDGNILFDRSISDILSAEDVAWLAGMIIYPLIGMAAKGDK